MELDDELGFGGTERVFTLEEARDLMPEVLERAGLIVRMRADLAELALAINTEDDSHAGGIAEAKALEAHLNEAISWFASHGIEVKGIAPLLIDFPSRWEGMDVRLCWVEGETDLAWYHRSELGFAGRRPLRAGESSG
ncbi:hypothetical protein LX16_0818 [Stackebrandtia albiflava]|uniref:DUF2203 family protein n=1 Tax=Stackebrandtia albiflava TaxID=406432 RepID=A0A562VB56_9ACTN|nr:DUF2203 domain-containing protein [Stackebrandtia albiflava]TWJ15120.1 hypothetical protein LX16_0818 [Stackebrandtia albiflava]